MMPKPNLQTIKSMLLFSIRPLWRLWVTLRFHSLLPLKNRGDLRQPAFEERGINILQALLFHLLEGHEDGVCRDCLAGALRYALYLKSHAQRVYGAVHGVDGAGAAAQSTEQ